MGKTEPGVHADETLACTGSQGMVMGSLLGLGFAVPRQADTRLGRSLEEILGAEFAGVLSSDL